MTKLLIPILLLFFSVSVIAQQTATELFHWEDTTLVGSNTYNNTYNNAISINNYNIKKIYSSTYYGDLDYCNSLAILFKSRF